MKKILFILALLLFYSISLSIAHGEDIEFKESTSDIKFTADKSEIAIGDTVTVSYEILTDIKVLSIKWISLSGAAGSQLPYSEGKRSGTHTFTVTESGECWLEITYQDSAEHYYVARSPEIKVLGSYDVKVTLTGQDSNDQIDAGKELTLAYEVTGDLTENITVEIMWSLDLGGAFPAEVTALKSSELLGSTSILVTNEMKAISYSVYLYQSNKRLNCDWNMENKSISVLSTVEDTLQERNIVFQTDQTEVHTGDDLVFHYTINGNIEIVHSRWIHCSGCSSNRVSIPNVANGTAKSKAQDGGTSWLEITYKDDKGNYHLAQSPKINVIGYKLLIETKGASKDGKIVAGDSVTLYYDIPGITEDGLIIKIYWDIDVGASFSSQILALTTGQHKGSLSFETSSDIKRLGYRVEAYKNDAYIASSFSETFFKVITGSNIYFNSDESGSEFKTKPIWTLGSDGTLVFIVKRYSRDDRTLENFLSIQVDGKTVPVDSYSTRKGSIIIELFNSYLNNLASGEHILTVNFTDGSAIIPFIISEGNTQKPLPKTGDTGTPYAWIIMMVIGISLIFCLTRRYRSH